MADSSKKQTNKLTVPEPPVALPAIISDIKTQKKDSDRFNIYANSIFLIGISKQVRDDFQLKQGDSIDHSTFKKLYTKEYYQKLRSYLLKLLGRREYSRLELYDKATKKGYDRNYTNTILDELESKNLLSNRRYTEFFVRDKFSLNRWGPRKIKSKLLKKGIDQNLIEEVIAENISRNEMRRCCLELLEKKRRTYLREDDPYKRKQKMLRFLSGRGFSGNLCFKAVETVLEKWGM